MDSSPRHLAFTPGRLNRRRFLAQSLAWVGAWHLGVGRPRRTAAAGMPDIAIAEGSPEAAVRAAVGALGGMQAFVRPGQKVVIKPNMSFAPDVERASNTHPEVVRALAALCREAGAGRVRVLDHPLRRAELCIEGVKQACRVLDEDMVHGLDAPDFFRPVPILQGLQMRETDVMQDVLEADVLIAAPVAKSHGSTGVSLSLAGSALWAPPWMSPTAGRGDDPAPRPPGAP